MKIEVEKEFLEKVLDAFGGCLGLAEAEFGTQDEEEEIYKQLKSLLRDKILIGELNYNGFDAKIYYSQEDNIYFGIVQNITDSVSFESEKPSGLYDEFKATIGDFLDLKNRLNE